MICYAAADILTFNWSLLWYDTI